jgi:hypothetical protein
VSRIRALKPETWISESLAEVTVEAERTFLAMTTHADDQGRHRDQAAIIAGLVWPLRAEHTAVHVEDDLTQLAAAGLICRYTGCDGKRYFHYPTWVRHQKIDKPSQSRLPACPTCETQRCGACKGPCTQPAGAPSTPQALPDASPNPPMVLGEPSPNPRGALAEDSPALPGALEPPAPAVVSPPVPATAPPVPAQDPLDLPPTGTEEGTSKDAGQGIFVGPSPEAPRSFGEGSGPGSRILDPGSSFPTGRAAPDAGGVSAKELVGEYVASCRERPPEDVLGHLGRVVKKLLAEGIGSEQVRAGLRRYGQIQGHPSRLPSLVNDAMNAPGGGAGLASPGLRPNLPAHTAWTNPADPATAYSGDL